MFSFRAPTRETRANINDRPIAVGPGETLLQAALRQGIDFPHSCRVGGCASCKCRLLDGQVRELTDASYILSDEDYRQRTILACQSVPLSDVRIAVDLSATAAHRQVAGRVIGQDRLTPDIIRLRVQLDEALAYRGGQYAQLGLAGLPGVQRSYSFANAARPDGQVSFFVRKMSGGVLSTHMHEHDLIGTAVTVQGPQGDFWLREDTAPLLLVAGGSGLAPLLALLQEAVAAGVRRPVTLLFGARGPQDLYALDEIEAIARQWSGRFRLVTVLSEVRPRVDWVGARGLVTDHIAAFLEDGAQAYLCGPPAMVDAAVSTLRAHGVGAEHIQADRFTTGQGAGATVATGGAATARAPAAEPARHAASVWDYLKFFLFHAIALAVAATLLVGGSWIAIGLWTFSAFYLVGDALLGDDVRTPHYRHPFILTVQLWLALPLLAMIVYIAVWSVSPGDPLGFGAWVGALTGYDVLARRVVAMQENYVALVLQTGLMIGMVGTITAHELTHRTWDKVSMAIGRWLLAFSFDTIFSIEHVYGHHRYVSTIDDPATAPRGRNVYHHIVVSTVKGNISAWAIERRRLRRLGHDALSLRNAVIRGHGMSLLLVAVAWALGGWRAALFFTLSGLWGKALLEIVNYMEHYGMVRNPATPVQPRHSWNTNKRLSSWSMFNLTRHSHHHAQGEVPYQDLRPIPQAPMMISGYLTTILVAMIPPLWHRLMTPKVLAWDRDYATPEERELAAQANARSGIPALQRSTAPAT